MSTSTELVPTSYDRFAWNAQHGLELPGHDSLLSAEQAAQINEQYDIQVFPGAHGAVSEESKLYLPTQGEYDAAKAIIDTMVPGDALFIENNGFRTPTERPLMPADLLETPFEDLTPHMKNILEFELVWPGMWVDRNLEVLEDMRQAHKITAWDYAQHLALLKGIPVIYADQDAYDKSARYQIYGKDLATLVRSGDPTDQAAEQSIQTRREIAAVNIIKDWALAHPVPPDSESQEDKPKLVLLFGLAHKKGLKEAFNNLGLTITMTDMENDVADRISGVIGQALGSIANKMSIPTKPTNLLQRTAQLARGQGSSSLASQKRHIGFGSQRRGNPPRRPLRES